MSLPRMQRHVQRRNRRLTSRSSSGQRIPLVVPTHRARRRSNPLRERNHEVVDVEAHSECIDLTSEHGNDDFIDLTSPTQTRAQVAVNDSPVIIVTGRDIVTPPRGRRRPLRSPDIENEIECLDLDIEISERPSTSGLGSPNRGTVNSPGIRRITCPICMDDYKELQQNKVQLMSTVCGHLFCKPCIQISVRTHRQCPTCRRRLTEKQIHPIFL
ncbi:E3 ubiquitin-protein ligase RNF4-like [Mytilus californianus]|uniref:E3 ubiquitin-protein ligase RNF4-like n=1 Tax=Mytilus californianus TaxID=6549 RepID=UPI0022455E59|nr:E3 ubiquitin-protein ligase RNF4-like [Mytilus californianus]